MDLGSLLDWLDRMEPFEQIKACKLLADTRTQGELVSRADALIFGLSRPPEGSVEAVATAVGLSRPNVERAITRHRKRVANYPTH